MMTSSPFLARSPSGRLLLVRLYDELTSGHLVEPEQEAAERISDALVRSRSMAVVQRRLAGSRMVFPFRLGGPTVNENAWFEAKRLTE